MRVEPRHYITRARLRGCVRSSFCAMLAKADPAGGKAIMSNGNGAIRGAPGYLDSHVEAFTRNLGDLVRIPSMSASGFPPEEVQRSAEATAKVLRRAGIENVGIIKIPGVHPYVYGDWLMRPGTPTRGLRCRAASGNEEAQTEGGSHAHRLYPANPGTLRRLRALQVGDQRGGAVDAAREADQGLPTRRHHLRRLLPSGPGALRGQRHLVPGASEGRGPARAEDPPPRLPRCRRRPRSELRLPHGPAARAGGHGRHRRARGRAQLRHGVLASPRDPRT